MRKNVQMLFLILAGFFGLTQIFATEMSTFYLERQDGSILEGYYSPPSKSDSPIIFAIQGSSCKSVSKWHERLSDQAREFGFGVISLEKHGISRDNIDSFSYNQTNCIQSRLEDYVVCLENTHLICPEWEGKLVFWGESEGGTLSAFLASTTPQTAAVLLFATGGGMKPRDEVKWALRYRLEKHGGSQDEIDQYMKFVDEQLDGMILDPTPEKQFLGNTYKWWASFLLSEEAVMPLKQQSLPIFLAHGTEDYQIPILSADLAVDQLTQGNALSYLRLEGYGHDLDHAEILRVACDWLASVLQGQQISDSILVAQIAPFAPTLLNNEQVDTSVYIFNRGKDKGGEGRGEVYGSARGDRDSNGQESYSLDFGVSYDFDNGLHAEIQGGASVGKDKDGDARGEAHAEAKVSKGF